MKALGFVLVVLTSQYAVLAGVFMEPTHIRLGKAKWPATQDSCKDCTQNLELFADMISSADTQELIKNTLVDLCARMPRDEGKAACHSKMKQYLPIAIHFLVKFMKPGQTCMLLGLCSSLSDGKEEEPLANHISDGHMTSMVPVGGTRMVQISPPCTLCLLIVKKLESMLPKERTEEAIVKFLGEVCGTLPAVYHDQCKHFVEKYGKELIDFLLSSAAPHTICMLLHLCLIQEMPLMEMPPPFECESCQTLMALSRFRLGSNLTESRTSSFLQSVCRLHPLAIPKCEAFTQRYGSRLLRILGKEGDVLDMCQKEDMCVAVNEAKMLGEDHCTWGRDYVCGNMKTALECDSVLYCQKYVWN